MKFSLKFRYNFGIIFIKFKGYTNRGSTAVYWVTGLAKIVEGRDILILPFSLFAI